MTRRRKSGVLRRLMAVLSCTLVAVAHAAEIKVLSAGAFKPVVGALAPAFERASGHRVVVDNDTAGAIVRRLSGDEAADLVIAPPSALEQLRAAGKVAAAAPVTLARVAIGVAVKEGAPRPDVASVESFQRSLLAARAVAMIDPASGGSSGVYLARLFERLGIGADIKAKAVLVPGGLVAQRVVSGEADLALHQISEILAVPGAVLVGPIPEALQNYTVYAGALGAGARDAAAARSLLDWLSSGDARSVLRDKGMLPP